MIFQVKSIFFKLNLYFLRILSLSCPWEIIFSVGGFCPLGWTVFIHILEILKVATLAANGVEPFLNQEQLLLFYTPDNSLCSCHRLMVIHGEMLMDRRKEYKTLVVGRGYNLYMHRQKSWRRMLPCDGASFIRLQVPTMMTAWWVRILSSLGRKRVHSAVLIDFSYLFLTFSHSPVLRNLLTYLSDAGSFLASLWNHIVIVKKPILQG